MVGYQCEAGDDILPKQINGIGCGSKGEEIIGKFGKEVKACYVTWIKIILDGFMISELMEQAII